MQRVSDRVVYSPETVQSWAEPTHIKGILLRTLESKLRWVYPDLKTVFKSSYIAEQGKDTVHIFEVWGYRATG